MTNPFGPAAQPQAAPANPFGPAAGPPPAPAPMAPPAYAPPAQQAAPAAPEPYGVPGQPGSSQWPAGAAPAPAPTLGTSFGRPAPVTSGGGQGADLKAMYGRLVLVLPIKVERGLVSNFVDPKTNQPRVQDRMTATFVVLDGDSPIYYGGDMYSMPQKPHDKSEPLPHVSKGLWVSQSKLIEACEPALQIAAAIRPGADGAMVLGRLLKNGTEANSAWILGEYNEAEQQIAEYYLAGVKSGQFVNPLA